MIVALQAGSEAAALGNVFIEAQKASDMLVGEARSKAAQINYDAKKTADDTIDLHMAVQKNPQSERYANRPECP